MLVDDVKWFIQTCHECQVHQMQRFHIPPTVPIIGGLFHKVYIDTMLMPRSGGYRYMYRPGSVCAVRLPRVAHVALQEFHNTLLLHL